MDVNVNLIPDGDQVDLAVSVDHWGFLKHWLTGAVGILPVQIQDLGCDPILLGSPGA